MKPLQVLISSLALTAFLSLPAVASESSCKATRWPYARNQSQREIVKKLKSIRERGAIEEYLFKELSEPMPGPLAYDLLTYLANTEENEDMLGFYELLRWGAEIKNESSSTRKLSLSEICTYYRKARKLGSIGKL
jgi:hypothetical protein